MRWYPPQEERGTRTKTVTSPHLQHLGQAAEVALVFVPVGMAASEGTTTGTTRDSRRGAATAATGSARGFQGAFLPWESLLELVAGVAGRLLLPCVGEVEGERWKQRFRCAPTIWFPSPPTGRPAALRPRYIRLTKLKAPKDQKKLVKGVSAPRGFPVPAVFL
jgi:hypothetical protein